MPRIDILDKLREKNLEICPLTILKNEASSYGIAVFQPLENITANDTQVKNENTVSISLKYEKFFSKEDVKNKSLLLSPEYSCPWSCLKTQLNSNFPKRGKLWILGCESIRINELKNFITENENITFIYEDLDNLDVDDRNFLDPIVMCFYAKDEEDNFKKVVVIQFKRRSMVDHAYELEKDHLIKGNDYYELRNDDSSVRLIPLICAEAINFDLSLDSQKAYIIPHLQLNTKPFHPSFMNYRLNIFKNYKNIEVICVNWAKGFKINGSSESLYGGSAYYLSSSKINDNDDRINKNHELGVYYSYSVSQYYHRYILNYDEHIFYLKSNQILQDATSNIDHARFGIEAKSAFRWQNSDWVLCTNCDDKWNSKLTTDTYYNRVSFLSSSLPMTKERFLSITSGAKLSKVDWYSPKNLNSFQLNSDEEPSKLSVFFDPKNKQDLNKVTGNINWLKGKVLRGNIDYPTKFKDLESVNDFTIHDNPEKIHLNISDGNSYATFVGINNDSKNGAERVFSNIADAIGSDQRKLAVWYEDDSFSVQKYCEENIKIDADFTESKKSITNDREGE